MAPSPTGEPHIGTAYIALFNYAFARHHGGQFVLRIEDTDQERSSVTSEQAIMDALKWTGLSWDEGPDCGGSYGPYRQSERTETYRQHVEELVANGHAYPCFCTRERLQALREEQERSKRQIGYDGHCANLPADEVALRLKAGESHVIRLRTPQEGACVIRDRFRGEIEIDWSTVDDQILMKADGYPTYHLANVVDDHLMQITHVMRGEEWISSTPKHLWLYEAFGWTAPEFAHLPLLRNPDKSKLSKRKNPTGILYYRDAGYLPEALLNFLGLMAYRPAGDEEVFSLEQMVASFDLERVSLGGPVFDVQKLQSFNGRYIREHSVEGLYERVRDWRLNADYVRDVLRLAQPRLNQLTDFMPLAGFMFADDVNPDATLMTEGADEPIVVANWLQIARWELERATQWDDETIQRVFRRMAEVESVKLKKLLPPFFVAVSGTKVSLPLFDAMVLLGRGVTLQRLQRAQEVLKAAGVGLSGKAVKRLQSEYQNHYLESSNE